MSSHLNRSGWKGTRAIGATVIWATATAAWFFFESKITASEWVNLSMMALGIYAASEVGAKAAVASVVKAKEVNKDGSA